MRRDLPSGTVTFLFTDVEGSTRLLHELGTEGYSQALAEHRQVLREAFSAHGGIEVDTQGDAFFYAFPTAPGALQAALRAQEALASGAIRVRIGLHTGTPHLADEGYVGVDVHRAARIAACGHGGQVLVSSSTAALAGTGRLRELGEHRLKDLSAPERIYQLGDEDFPPLKSLHQTNLPIPATAFLGRERELQEVLGLLAQADVRLLTLTGPGGTGKTRLGMQAAAVACERFPDGVWWVPLAPLRDPELVLETAAQTLGATDGLADHIGEKRLMLLFDNFEQVIEAAPELSELLAACPRLELLVTSRELLRVPGEQAYPVPPLDPQDGTNLFLARARAAEPGFVAGPAVPELCRRLDNLPLALELAAARVRILSPEQLLARLSERLDLLKAGRGVDVRQRTLRATIEWSYELLDDEEKRLFAQLAVFAGGRTLEAVDEVTEADLDVLQSLVDKSLLRHSGERFWMLETIREYALERLEESGEAEAVRRRHALYFRKLAARLDAALRAGEPEEGPVSVIGLEINNVRAAVEFGLEAKDTDLVREITASLSMYWIVHGFYPEARSWLERALALGDKEDDTRRRLLSALATVAYSQGDHALAVAASDAAASLAMRLGGVTERFELLKEGATAALMKDDYEVAENLYEKALSVAMDVDNGVGASSCRLNLAYLANKTGRHDRADALLTENLPFVRAKGQTRCEAYTLASIAETLVFRDRAQDAAKDAGGGARRALQIGDRPLVAFSLDLFAASAAARGDVGRAAIILAATEVLREAMEIECDEDEEAIRAPTVASVKRSLGEAAFAEAWEEGRMLSPDEAVALALDSLD